ncbi:cupin domain-containing protein [bacterium]|nr:cupin domain-containing protein [bacterium]
MTEKQNIFSDLPVSLPEEIGETIVNSDCCRVEKIVSTGQASPDGFWYDQEESEWVLLLRGSATITFEEGDLKLLPGDHINIPPHRRHRLKETAKDEPTVWICVFYK